MAYQLEFADGVGDDVQDLDDREFALVEAILDLVEGNEEVQDRVARYRFRCLDPRFDTCPLTEWTQRGYEVGRIKMWHDRPDGDLAGVRIIYAVDHRTSRIVVLGYMPHNDQRDENYRTDTPYGQRLKRDYDNCGVPRLRR